MKPYNINEGRVPIYIGDIIYVKDDKNLYFVDEIRHNRRRYDQDGLTTEKKDVSLSGLLGKSPDRFVRLNAIGLVNRTDNLGYIKNLKRGEDSILSKVNVDNIVLDINTCSELGGSGVNAQARWGPLPLDIWAFTENDIYTAEAYAKTAPANISILLDVTEYQCKTKALAEFGPKGEHFPEEIVIAALYGTRRLLSKDFVKLQQWL